MAADKLKVAMYWGGACGGCDVALLDIHEMILDVVAVADLLFWPCAMDFKYTDVEKMPDQHLDVTFFSGAIRNSENEHVAQLLRRKSKVMVAFGACAHMGGIPGLANFYTRDEVFQAAYLDSPSTPNPDRRLPQRETKVPEGTLQLPEIFDTVRTLAQAVPVDFYLPGCPPNPKQIGLVIQAAATGALPPRGAVVGASDKAMCEECPRKKKELKFKEFKRRHLVHPDPEQCFMEQGIICIGAATRAGCGWRCIGSNMPCRGCYGPLPHATDQGAKILSAIASHIDSEDPAEIDRILDSIPDPAGYFYRFGLPMSLLHCKQRRQAP
ncbi:MAG TPA: oxidoreductase [Myxococcota bacterium]|nr:oxidoreductase [Myxococcota bacterium]HRY95621.1 oxidoreductase [Myxococcota bacterium]HSA20121.1 oxidoreductase [Myxococcota bacterium]